MSAPVRRIGKGLGCAENSIIEYHRYKTGGDQDESGGDGSEKSSGN